ncbi:hypothetical protein [Streptomyces tibetensis]|uniref:hypothetical protein n=1 Tax=Streptomyces tibetensis TaxID=2382123 RepID=UPI0034065615
MPGIRAASSAQNVAERHFVDLLLDHSRGLAEEVAPGQVRAQTRRSEYALVVSSVRPRIGRIHTCG